MKVLALVGEALAPAYALSGMEVFVPRNTEELRREFTKAVQRHNLVLIVISARLAQNIQEEIDAHRASNSPVMILEVASSKGDFHPGAKLQKFVREAIGQG